jgi:hypothetical protein
MKENKPEEFHHWSEYGLYIMIIICSAMFLIAVAGMIGTLIGR